MNRKGKVTYKDQIVGTLSEIPSGGTSFSYADEWNTTPIACVFPIHQRRFERRQGLHPFFQNLCPEGWLREGQAKVARLADDRDDFGFLLRFGRDCIGAVGIVTESFESSPPIQDEMTASIQAHKTLSGIHKKLLAYKREDGTFHASIDGTPANYIAKFNTARLPDLVRNEFNSLRIAREVLGKAHVTYFELGQVCNEMALMVERFDRKDVNTKLRMEEFSQILGKSISENSSASQIDLALYFKQVVFSMLIGNCDAHLKNFALLETPRGLRLSPAYDLLNTIMYPEYSSNLALSLCGNIQKHDQIDRALFIAFGKNIGLQDDAIRLALAELYKGFKRAQQILMPPAAEDPVGFYNRYKDIVDAACIRILEET